jgi:predicted ATP-binding protein involved in virulence
MANSSPPIGIRSIEITNFRSIDHLKLDFTDPQGHLSDLIVIAGPNGSGKTSVLEACLLALGYYGASNDPYLRGSIRHGESKYEICCQVKNGGHDQIINLALTKTNDGYDLPSNDRDFPSQYFRSTRSQRKFGPVQVTIASSIHSNFPGDRDAYYNTKQLLVNTKSHALMSRGKLANDDVFVSNLKAINDCWKLFYPHLEQSFDVLPVNDDPSSGFDVYLVMQNGQKISVDNLSSGQLEVFGLFGSLITSQFREGVLVIDEPELHLDPQWHGLILRAIRKFLPKLQVIVGTHSPAIYDMALSYQRFFLIADDDPRAKAWNMSKNGVAFV